MKLRKAPLVLNNVISASLRSPTQEWLDAAWDLRSTVTQRGIYGTGPVFFQVNKFYEGRDEADFTYYLPVNQSLVMNDNDTYGFTEKWRINDGFFFRHPGSMEDIKQAYETIYTCAGAYNLELQWPFYHLILEVYGGVVIDIYAPIISGEVDI